MQTTLNHLSLNHRERLQLLVTEIVKAIAPEKIICYGFQLNAEQHWNVSQSWHNRHDELCCYLLIVPPATDPRNDDSLLNQLQKIAIPGITASAIVHKRKGINECYLQPVTILCFPEHTWYQIIR